MASATRIAIVGGGIGGLSLAAGLKKLVKSGVDVRVYEEAPELRPRLGGAFKLDAGAAALREIGLEKEYLKWSQPYDHVVIQTAQGRRLGNINIGSQFSETILNRTPNAESDRPHIAGLIMREHLQTILKNAVPAEQIELNKELDTLYQEADEMVLGFTDGSEARADLVVAADGVRSAVRDSAFGLRGAPTFSGYQVQYVVSRTNVLPSATITHTIGDGVYAWAAACGPPEDRFEVLPIYSKYSTELPEDWHAASRSVKEDMLELLDEGQFPKEHMEIVTHAERIFNLGVFSHDPLPSWIAKGGRVVALGDACHATTPFLTAGANQAVQDGVCLAMHLADMYRTGGTLLGCLSKYEQKRKGSAEQIIRASASTGTLLVAGGLQRLVGDARLLVSCATGSMGRTLVARGLPVY